MSEDRVAQAAILAQMVVEAQARLDAVCGLLGEVLAGAPAQLVVAGHEATALLTDGEARRVLLAVRARAARTLAQRQAHEGAQVAAALTEAERLELLDGNADGEAIANLVSLKVLTPCLAGVERTGLGKRVALILAAQTPE